MWKCLIPHNLDLTTIVRVLKCNRLQVYVFMVVKLMRLFYWGMMHNNSEEQSHHIAD